MAAVLLAVGDSFLRTGCAQVLRNVGHTVFEVERPLDVVSASRVMSWDSCCVDESQLGRDTLVVLRTLGLNCRIFLTDEGTQVDVTRLSLPLDPEELLGAIADVRSQAEGERREALVSDLRLERFRRVALGPKGEVLLTRTESRLLELLIDRRPALVPIDEILSEVWGYTNERTDTDLEIVRTHVRNLRRKLEQAGFIDAIQSQRGRGYRLAIY